MKLDAIGEASLERAERFARELSISIGQVRPRKSVLEHYDLARALLWAASGCREGEGGVAEIVHDAFRSAGHRPLSNRSLLIPRAVLATGARAAPYESGVATAGQELIETTLTGAAFIDALRPASRVLRLGAQVVGGLKGDILIPRESTASTAFWQATPASAPAAATESEAAFDSSPLTVAPAVLVGYGKASRLLLQQTGGLANRIISRDINQAIGTAIDVAAIQGSGSGGAPAGITATSGVNSQSGTSLALAGLVASITSIASANAVVDPATLGWVTTPAVASLLTQRFEDATSKARRLWQGNVDSGTIDNLPAYSTTNCPSATAIAGCWSQLLLLLWGADDEPLELEINRYSANFAGGDVQFRVMLSANLAVRHPQSFTVVSSIT